MKKLGHVCGKHNETIEQKGFGFWDITYQKLYCGNTSIIMLDSWMAWCKFRFQHSKWD